MASVPPLAGDSGCNSPFQQVHIRPEVPFSSVLARVFFASCVHVYGPMVVSMIYAVGKQPYLLFIFLLAGFFQILGLLCASALGLIWQDQQDTWLPMSVLTSVLFQEITRFCFQRLLRRSDTVLMDIIHAKDLGSLKFRLNTALAAGLGFGFVAVTVILAPILEAAGAGQIRAPGCNHVSFYLVAGESCNVETLYNGAVENHR